MRGGRDRRRQAGHEAEDGEADVATLDATWAISLSRRAPASSKNSVALEICVCVCVWSLTRRVHSAEDSRLCGVGSTCVVISPARRAMNAFPPPIGGKTDRSRALARSFSEVWTCAGSMVARLVTTGRTVSLPVWMSRRDAWLRRPLLHPPCDSDCQRGTWPTTSVPVARNRLRHEDDLQVTPLSWLGKPPHRSDPRTIGSVVCLPGWVAPKGLLAKSGLGSSSAFLVNVTGDRPDTHSAVFRSGGGVRHPVATRTRRVVILRVPALKLYIHVALGNLRGLRVAPAAVAGVLRRAGKASPR